MKGFTGALRFQLQQHLIQSLGDSGMRKLRRRHSNQLPLDDLVAHPIVGELLERLPAQQIGRRRHQSHSSNNFETGSSQPGRSSGRVNFSFSPRLNEVPSPTKTRTLRVSGKTTHTANEPALSNASTLRSRSRADSDGDTIST